MLAGKRLLITGVLTRKSIAFAAAREALKLRPDSAEAQQQLSLLLKARTR